MNKIKETRNELINNIYNTNCRISLNIMDFFYIIVSDNPYNNEELLNAVKKIINIFDNNDYVTCEKENITKIFNYANNYGLEESINKEIYELLELYETIKESKMDISIIQSEIDKVVYIIKNS